MRRGQRRLIADGKDAIERASRSKGLEAVRRIVELNGHRVIAPRIFEHVTAIGGEHQFESQALGGLGEGVYLIAGGGGEQQYAGHLMTRTTAEKSR